MTGLEIMSQARTIVGDVEGRRYNDSILFAWLDEAGRLLIDQTELLQDGKYQTTLTADSAASTSVKVADVKLFRAGDVIDIIKADGTKEGMNKTIASITVSTKTLTLTVAVTATSGSRVWFHNDSGLINLVADQAQYDSPSSLLRVKQVLIKHSASSSYRVIPQIERPQTTLPRAQNVGWPTGSERATWVQGYMRVGQDTIELFPAPAEAIVNGLQIMFIRCPLRIVTPDDTPEVPTQFHQGLVRYLAMQMAGNDGNTELAQQQGAMFQSYIASGRQAMGFPGDLPNIQPAAR
jgi:hypothetical protein